MPTLYICHHLPNVDRKAYLDEILAGLQFNHKYISIGMPVEGNSAFAKHKHKVLSRRNAYQEILCNCADVFMANAIAAQSATGKIDSLCYDQGLKILNDIGWPNVSPNFLPSWLQARELSDAELSLNLKHRYCLSMLLMSADTGLAIIVEDDVIFHSNTVERLFSIFNALSSYSSSISTPVYVDLGGGCRLQADASCNDKKSQFDALHLEGLVSPILRSSRTTCAYIVNKPFANLFFKTLPTPCGPIDFEFTYSLSRNPSVKCLWAEPPVFEHGSQDGSYKSSIQN